MSRVIVIGEQATGKTTMVIQLIVGGTSHVKVVNADGESIAAKYADLSNDKMIIAPTSSMQEDSLVVNVDLPGGERQIDVSWIDTPGEAFSRNAWRSDNPAAWQSIKQKISSSDGIIILLPPPRNRIKHNLQRQSDDPCDLDELPTSEAWVKGVKNWLSFLSVNCNRFQYVVMCLHKADLICDVKAESKQWRYRHSHKMSWYDYNQYVKNTYFDAAKESISEFSRNTNAPNISFFLTTQYNKSLLELPWVYLGSYLGNLQNVI